MKLGVFAALCEILFAFASTATAGDSAKPLLVKHCGSCHGDTVQQGKFRVDTLPDPTTADAAKAWGRVFARLDAGTMPPPGADKPSAEDTSKILNLTKTALAEGGKAYRAAGRSKLRRLNRLEYENTIHDLLGVRTPLKNLLPDDDTADGFDTAAQALSISPVHIQRYLDAATAALKDAAVRGGKPEAATQRFSYDHPKEKGFTGHNCNSHMIRPRNNGELIFFAEPHIEVPAVMRQFSELTSKSPSRYKVRVSAYTHDANGKSLAFALKTTHSKELLGYFDAPPDKPGVIEIDRYFGPGDTVIVAPYKLNFARGVLKLKSLPACSGVPKPENEPTGLGLAIQWIEVEGPLTDVWPPVGHTRLFGDTPLKPFKELPKETLAPGSLSALRNTDKLTPIPSGDLVAAAKPLLRDFLARAFRRPVTDDEVAPYFAIVTRKLAEKECFESAMRAAHTAALCSPDFLFLVEEPGPLNDHALAARLSYFLWRTHPDDALRATADKGELRKPDVLRRETDRLLASPKANAFVNDFVGQWLHLRDIDATMPDKLLFPEYYELVFDSKVDGLLRASLLAETRLYFADLLKTDGSVRLLIDSKHTFLNNRLAEFYGLPAVPGVALRKTELPADTVRGGVLTHGSILKVTANGANTSPVVRGAWVLDAIVGRPPAPPPPNVGSIEPDTRGATTIREQLAKHQSNKSCAACHRQIDPPGFALEAFDPIGQFRTFYRTTEKGEVLKGVTVDGHGVKYKKGPPVDATGGMLDGTKFGGPKDFKALLAKQPEAVARCVASKLATYSTGHATEPADLLALDAIVAKSKDFGLRSIVHELIQSELFRTK